MHRIPSWVAGTLVGIAVIAVVLLVVMTSRLGVVQAVAMIAALLLLGGLLLAVNLFEESVFDRILRRGDQSQDEQNRD